MRRTLALAAVLALAACASQHTTLTGELKLKPEAEGNYQAGLDEAKGKHWPEATRFFEYVKTKYPFSPFAALAELRLADVKFQQDRFPEAAEAYGQFVQLHPDHPEADYAQLRQGVSYFRDAPGEFVLFPPAHEKDQRGTEKAVVALESFLKERPTSKHADEARKVLAEARGRLAAREWYVAEFYFKRKQWPGAAGRYEALIERYPGSRHEAEALWKLAESYLKLEDRFKARTALQKLVVTHPGDARRGEAEKLFASLR
jgi:outer membrane protein assembly factor BamD